MVGAVNGAGPARGDGRGLQPHAGVRAGPEVDPRPDRAGVLPAAQPRDRGGGDLDVLPEHGDRAPHDGEADGRLGRDVGARLQGRRLPLRPDGPSHEGEHARGAARARRLDAAARRRRRPARSSSTARAGTSARWPTTRASSRRPSATWPAPGSPRSPTGCATPYAAAARSTTTRASRASPSGLFTDPNDSPANGTPAEQRARLLHYHDLIKVGLAGNLRDYRFVDAAGRHGHGRRRGLQRPARRLRRGARTRRSPTSTRTTTRRCSTRSRSSCRPAPRWPTGCA